MPKLQPIELTRIVADEAALETAVFPLDALIFRVASDERLIMPASETVSVADDHAIILTDGSFTALWLEAEAALSFLQGHCEWELPTNRPAFAQGLVADIPTKLWLEDERVLFLVPAPYVNDFAERLG